MITPQPGYIVDPNNPNGVIPDPAAQIGPGGIPTAPPVANNPSLGGNSYPPITSLGTTGTSGPTQTGTTGSSSPAITPPGPGLGLQGFTDVMNSVQKSYDATNPLLAERQALLQQLYLGSPLTPEQLSKLPPDLQQLIQSGNIPLMQVRLAATNDQISGRSNSLANSIQFLTTGYQKAQDSYNQALNTITSIAQQTGQSPVDILKATHPELWAQMTPDQQKAFENIPVPYAKTTQVSIGGTGSFNVTIPTGTIASKTNNPLNIKYVDGNQLGGTDSGIAGQDGGTFAAFASPQAGLDAAIQLLQSPSYSNLTIDQAMKRWSNNGYGAEVAPGFPPTQKISSLAPDQLNKLVSDMAQRESGTNVSSAADDQAQAYVDGIKNGTITSIAQVPAAYKSIVSTMMANQNVSTPLSDRRFVMAANGIISNYISLPEYQLTANALPYILKIDAAKDIPGSVSDQELLDSFTKLSTAGGVITDAQVSVITGGRSIKDSLNVYQKRLAEGGVLSDNQRQQIFDLAQASYKNLKAGYQPIYDEAARKLTASGIPEQYWTLPDLNTLSATSEAAVKSQDSSSGSSTYDAYLKAIGQ